MPMLLCRGGGPGRQCVQHSEQMRSRQLDVRIFVLARARLGSKNRTAMNIHEIAIGEFVSTLAAFGLLVIFPEMPFPEFGESVLLDEFLFSASGRLVVGPVASLVEHASPIPDELLRVFISSPV
ncbi:MAG: hypothetical protein ACXU9D_00085 [Xanthobacteraceae bacterium]